MMQDWIFETGVMMLLNFNTMSLRLTFKKQTGYRKHKYFRNDLFQKSIKGSKFSKTKLKSQYKNWRLNFPV